MMTPDQVKIVSRTYNHLIESEKRGWDVLDDYIDYLEYLDDDQLHREADVVHYSYANVPLRCPQEHSKEKCFVPLLVEAVGYIIELYKERGSLHEKNKYILHYFLAMHQAEMIVVESGQ